MSCEDLHLFRLWSSYSEITEIDYNPDHGLIYAVRSHPVYGRNQINKLDRCPPDKFKSCNTVSTLGAWATIHVAFDAMWISDAGKIQKCPLFKLKKETPDCFDFHNFNISTYTSIRSSSKYLYVRLESDYGEPNHLWFCDPEQINSCTKTDEYVKRKKVHL